MRARALPYLAALVLALPGCAAVPPAGKRTIRITVLHTNDMHGWIMPRPDKNAPQRLVGGAAALAKGVASFRKDGPTLLVDAGDWFQGTPEGSLTQGRSAVDVLNAVGYDAVAPGNHEFDVGVDGVRSLAAGLKMPVLAANVLDAKTRAVVDFFRPYVIREVGGVKVGLFGLLTTQMKALAFEKNIAGLEFQDEVEAARNAVARLRAEGAEVVIALSHLGLEQPGRPPFVGDRALAARVPGIDVIVGAHTHTPIFEPAAASTAALIVQSAPNMTFLGYVKLEIDPVSRKVVGRTAGLTKLWVDEYGADEDVARIAKRYEEEVGRELDVAIATAAVTLTRERQKESTAGDWVADCVRDWSGTQLAFQNGGGVRADVPAGAVKLRHIFEVMPFDNYVATLSLTGAQVRSILERGVSGTAGMIQVSGLSLAYDAAAQPGSRVREVLVAGQPLRDDAAYTVAAPDFMVQGGDAYTAFTEGRGRSVTPTLVREVLAECAKKGSPVTAKPLDRIIAR